MHTDPFDLTSLFSLRELWQSLDPTAPPSIATLKPPGQCRTVALLPGSFNPPTAAHLLLAERALREGFDCVLLLLARNTVGKEPNGLVPEDRLLAMRAAAGGMFGVGASSHGLYADQAEAAQKLYPDAEITFLVGSDKVVEIFDPRWYDGDRDAVLERLFRAARLVVAPRSDQGELLRTVLDAPENRRFADSVSVLRLHPAVSDLSSTRVRGLLRAGAEPAGLVPGPVAEMMTAMRAFAPPIVIGNEEIDAYSMRTKLIDVLWHAGSRPKSADLHELVTTALSPTIEGTQLRHALAHGVVRDVDLMRARVSGL